MIRTDETWHRLREWTYGQASSERLAAQILLADGFSSVDPSHPLGGPDGGRDAIALRDGERWIVAAYFPRGQQAFRDIKKKLLSDSERVAEHGARGIACVTNQEILLAQRRELQDEASVPIELIHLERLTAILDQPQMYGVREQFLRIPLPSVVGAHESPSTSLPANIDALELEYRRALDAEFGFLSTRGLPRDLRQGEPRLPMEEVFVPLRVEPPIASAGIRDALEHLSYRERRVLELRFGLDGRHRRTLREVGRTFNVTNGRISQIEEQAIERLQSALRQGNAFAGALDPDRQTTVEILLSTQRGMSVLTMLRARRLVILGGPGAGKSTLTRYLAWTTGRKDRRLSERLRNSLPFRVSASEFGDALTGATTDLLGFVLTRAGRYAPTVSRALADRRLLLILDGLDEVTDHRLGGEVQRAVNRFLGDSDHEDVSVVLTSRPVGFHPEGVLAELPTVMLAPLNLEETERFLLGWFAQVDGPDPESMADRLMRRLRPDERMRELAGNPLLLTVLALLQARNERLPNERAQLYAAATETLMHSWPLEQRGSVLSYDTVPRWLAPLAQLAFLSPPNVGVAEEEAIEILTTSWQQQFGGSRGAAREKTRALLDTLSDDAGLLSVTGRSAEGDRLWDFLHRSFAEYLVARQLADSYIRSGDDPLDMAHEEPWRAVILMMFGELGRRLDQLVGPLLTRTLKLRSVPWESQLRRNLRLALSVLANDVPCDRSAAEDLIDESLRVWRDTAIHPLRAELGRSMSSFAETRYAGLLAERADLLITSAEQRLAFAQTLGGEGRRTLLNPLLDRRDASADEAAIVLLVDGPSRPALAYLRRRQLRAQATGDPSAAIARLARELHRRDPDLAEMAAKVLARRSGHNALVAMEGLLDLYREPWLKPILDRLTRASRPTRTRLLALASTQDACRFGALLVLLRQHTVQAELIVDRLLNNTTAAVREGAEQLLEFDSVKRLVPEQREASAVIAAVLRGQLSVVSGLDMLAGASPDELMREAKALLRRRSDAMARQSGARLLTLVSDSQAEELARTLLDDRDSTVRCAAVWALRDSEQHRGLILDKIGELIADCEPITGPPLDAIPSATQSPARGLVHSCADAAFVLLEGLPS